MKKWLIVSGGLIVLLLAAGSVLTLGRLTYFSCVDCGVFREDKNFLGFKTVRQERRPRTDWYDHRIGLPHEHRWIQTSCTVGMNLWQATMYYSYGESEPLASDYFYLATILRRLERLNLDLEFHRDVSHPDRQHRLAAAQAWLEFNPNCHDSEVPQWWNRARTYLGDRSLWNQTFREWAYPPIRMTSRMGDY